MVVRVILSPHHLKKNSATKLDKKAFEAPHGSDEVSVARGAYVSNWLLKAYAKARVQRPRNAPPKIYRGLAFVSVEVIRALGSSIVDSRCEYLGHADISHGVVRERGVALRPDLRLELDTRLQKIVDATHYVHDPQPGSMSWRG